MGMPEPHSAVSPRGDRTRKAILKAARELLSERGVAGMSMSRLERASGAKLGSIYFHFGSKDGVVAAAIRQTAEEFMSQDPLWEELDGEPLERLRKVLDITALRFEEHPDFLRAVLTLALSPRDEMADREMRALRNAVIATVDEYMRKAFGAKDDLTQRLTPFVVAFLDGAYIAKDLDPNLDLRALFGDLYTALIAIADAGPPDNTDSERKA